MSLRKILDEITQTLTIERAEMQIIDEESKKFVLQLREELRKARIEAEVFIGGSFAKGTLVSGEFYDVDVFVRFDWRYENISPVLEDALKKIAKKYHKKLETIHGSRDYFRILVKNNIIFEIVPVARIKKPREARNVTDLSYFHVNYVKRELKKNKLQREVLLAKQFCKAQKVYGAESYVNGFSGYALECLIIYYKSFEKMLRELGKIKIGERIIIDPAKAYKNTNEVLFEMNESKLGGPVVLVDPTWKERNVLAALNRETFERFQEAAREFLKKPERCSFAIEKFDAADFKEKAKKKKAEFLKIDLKTERQPGDIAGTKMKKFSNYLERELTRYFEIVDKEFDYNGEHSASFYLAVKPKKELIKTGPPKNFEVHAKAFRKNNKGVFEKNGVLYAKEKVNLSAKTFLKKFEMKYSENIKSMGITGLKVN